MENNRGINEETKDTKTAEEAQNEEVNVSNEEIEGEAENITDINAKLEEKKLKDEIADLNDKYQRLQAEYANYRRRTNEEKENIGIFANEKIMAELIPVIDNMERALDSADKGTAVYQGVELVLKQLLDTLGKFGLKEIPAEDEPFDPNFHQAVMQDHICGVEPGKVVDVLQKGYKLNEKVVRATMVKVSC